MDYQTNTNEKRTEPVLDWMRTANRNDQAELIVRLKDPYAIERAQSRYGEGGIESIEQEQQHVDQSIESLAEYIRQLESQSDNIKLRDTSWLTHSVLVEATPEVVDKLTQRDDIDLIDLNAAVKSA